MKKLMTIALCLFCWMSSKGQTYTITMDSTICRMEVNRGSQLREMFLIDRVMYVDRGSNPNLLIFDGISAFEAKIAEVNNYVSIAALKTDIDTYIQACR